MRASMYGLVVLVLSLLMSACSSNDSIDIEPAELVDFEPQIKLRELWSKNVGGSDDERYTLLVPAISGERIFATDAEGVVTALDRNTGKQLWEVELDTAISGGVGAGVDLVLVGTYSGDVIALSQEDGAERWRIQVSSEIFAPPQINGNVVVVQTVDGKLLGLNATDGTQNWLYDNTLPVLTLRGTGVPVVTDDSVYAGFSTGKIIALDVRTGILRWEQRVSVAKGRTELERVIDVDGAPLLAGDLVYAANFQGRIAAFGRANGRVIWAKDTSSFQNLAAGFGNVYLVTDADTISAYRASSGEVMWENEKLLRRKVSAPQTFDRYIVVGDSDGFLHVIDQTSGEFVARRKIDGDGLRSPMIASGEVLYVLSNGGELTALKVAE